MDIRTDDWIGLRVARWRSIAGMSQQDLATKLGVTRAYVSLIENGRKPVTTRALLIGLAQALNVSTGDLTQAAPSSQTEAERAMSAAVPDVRAALDGAWDVPVPTVDGQAADVDLMMRARMACDYGSLANGLAPAIAAGLVLAETDGSDRARNLFSQILFTASLTVKPLGYVDLGMRLAERAQHAATDLVHEGAANFARAQASLAGGVMGLRSRSYAIATRAADQLQDVDTDEARTWYGMLHLHAALVAATMGNTDGAMAHLDEADERVESVSGDPWRMEFSKANVGVWRVGVALEGDSDGGRAIEYARQVNVNDLRTTQRQAHLRIHTGRALYLADRSDEAVRAFITADDLAPHEVRSRTTVRELTGQMLRDARRKAGSDDLRDLAQRVGVDPLAPEA